MKRVLTTLFFCTAACFGSTTYYIDAGTMSFGAGRGALSSQVTVTMNGAPAYQRRIWNYFDFNGELNVVLPPGVTGTCTGAPCNIYTPDPVSGGMYNPTAGNAPATATAPYSYGVDVVYAATSGACSSATAGIFSFTTAPFSWPVSDSNNGEYGNKITVDTSGYICAVRFLKGSADTNAHHTVHLWNGSTSIVSATSGTEAASGWITVPITPVAISPGTVYIASFGITNGSVYYVRGLVQNASPHNGPIRLVGFFVDSNSTCFVNDNWPTNPDGLPAAGVVGCGDIKTDGTLAAVYRPAEIDGGGGGATNWGINEGCQCMIGGRGPGPFAIINTRIDGTGNTWHFDDGGGQWSHRGDYYLYRGLFTAPDYAMTGTVVGDGNRYFTRQKLEWKGGHRIYIGGSIFEHGFNDISSSSDSIAFSNYMWGESDINLEYNEFRHTVGGFSGSGSYGNNETNVGPPLVRFRVANNVFWDLGGYHTVQSAGNAWIYNGPAGVEDFVMDHNTVLPLMGRAPAIFWQVGTKTEGFQVTNNIFPIASSHQGASSDGSFLPACPANYSEVLINCIWHNYTFKNNIMYPSQWSYTDAETGDGYGSSTTHDNIMSWYPTIAPQNYVPTSTDPAAMKWFQLPSFPADNHHYATAGDYHVRMDSPLSPASPGSSYKTTDGKAMGADMQAFAAAQGYVDHIGVPPSGITTTSANVVFVAPDSQACPVDYMVDDSSNGEITSGFTRVADTGTANRKRSVSLTGLTANTPYRYQIRCAVQQPLGRFRTR